MTSIFHIIQKNKTTRTRSKIASIDFFVLSPTDAWSMGPPLSAPRRGCGIAIRKGKCYKLHFLLEPQGPLGASRIFYHLNMHLFIFWIGQLIVVGGTDGSQSMCTTEILDLGNIYIRYTFWRNFIIHQFTNRRFFHEKKIYLTCLFLKKGTRVFKGQGTNFKFWKGACW